MRRKWKQINCTTWRNADELRLNQTSSEQRLWQRIRANQLGVRFRGQHPIGSYIVDFCCVKKHIVVELDGDSHADNEAKANDAMRSNYLTSNGWHVLRYSNSEVQENIDAVFDDIISQLNT